MNDSQLLEALAATNPCPADADPPAAAWGADDAFTEVERMIGTGALASRTHPAQPLRPRWLVAAAVFVTVLLVGGVLLLAAGRGSDDEIVPGDRRPPVTTLAPTTRPPVTTVAPAAGEPISPETQSVLVALERAYDRGDAEAAGLLLDPDASVILAPWVSPDESPSAVSLVDRIVSGSGFDEDISIGECSRFDTEIRCAVAFTDRFAEVVGLEPWQQAWTVEIEEDRLVRVEVAAADDEREIAMRAFADWLESRAPGALPVLAADLEWRRTPAVAETLDTYLVEYGALQNGVAPDAWALVSGFYEALTTGDIAAAEALFLPGGAYVSTDSRDVNSSAIGPLDGSLVGDPGMRDFWTWQWQWLQTQWSPRSCSGDAATVVCRTELRGVISAHLPGGRSTGRVVFTLAPDGIAEVVDELVLGSQPFDIRSFWRTGIPDIAPEVEGLWPGGNGVPPFTTEFARIVLELYPQWLADNGIPVPAEYLDGSLLEGL
jgi:hypothetical protein